MDKYDVYEVLLSYWQSTMADDVFLLKYDGYAAGREIEYDVEITENKKGEKKEKIKGWDGKLIPKAIIEKVYFPKERAKIDEAQRVAEETQAQLEELIDEQTEEGGALADCLNDKGAVDIKEVKEKLIRLQWTDPEGEETKNCILYRKLFNRAKEQAKIVRELYAALDQLEKDKYPTLTEEEIKELLVNRKWYYTIFEGISARYAATSHSMASRILELAERYEHTLPELEKDVADYEAKVKAHLERMGYKW